MMKMRLPSTLEEYWTLPREKRRELYEKYGFGWRTILGGGLAKPKKTEPLGQGELFDFMEEESQE